MLISFTLYYWGIVVLTVWWISMLKFDFLIYIYMHTYIYHI
jgi:hypothetical protein